MTGVALIGMLVLTEGEAGFRGTLALLFAAVCSAVGGDPYLSASAANAAEGSISLGLLPLNVTLLGLGTLGWVFTRRLRATGTTALRDVLLQAARTVLAFTAIFLPLSLLTRYRSDDGAVLNFVGQFGVSVWSSLIGAFLFGAATLGLTSLLSPRTVLPPPLQRIRHGVRAPLGGAAYVLAAGGVVLAVTLLIGLFQQDERLALLGGAALGASNGVLASVLWSGGVPLTMEGGLATSVLGGFQRTASQSIDLTTITDVSGWFWLAPVVLLVVALVVAMALVVRQDSVPDARREGLRFAAALAVVAFAAALLLRISVSSEGSAVGASGSAGGTATFNPFLAGLVFAVWGAVAGLLAPVLATRAPVGFVSFVRRRFGTASDPGPAADGGPLGPPPPGFGPPADPAYGPTSSPVPHPSDGAHRRAGNGLMLLLGGIVFALVAAVLAVVLLAGRGDPLAGTWIGQVSQAGSTYSLEVTLSEVDGQVRGRSLYPELNCGGTWTETARSDATVTVVERIDHGFQFCVDGSSATLAVDQEGRLQVAGGNWQATLTRSD